MNHNFKDLQNSIFIENEFRRIAAPIVQSAIEASKPFIGKKIETLKGLTQKFADAVRIDREQFQVKPLPNTKWANVHRMYVDCSYSDLRINISLCFSDGSTGCTYKEQTFYFGKVENGVLMSINENCKVNDEIIDFDAELAKIKILRELEKQVENAKDKIKIHREAYKYVHF